MKSRTYEQPSAVVVLSAIGVLCFAAASALAEESAPAPTVLPASEYSASVETTSSPEGEVYPDFEHESPAEVTGLLPDSPLDKSLDCAGIRMGLFLTSGGDAPPSTPLFHGALFHRSRMMSDELEARRVWELALGLVQSETIGGLQSYPVTGELNVLIPLRANPRAQGYLATGVGILFEVVTDELAGGTFYNYAGVMNVGAGTTFAKGRFDLRFMYGRLLGSPGADEQLGLTFGLAF